MEINKLLIDTNVCLDAAQHRKPFAGLATEILALSEAGQYSGYIAGHSFDTIFYFLQKNDSRETAYDGIKGLRKAVNVAPVTESVIDDAVQAGWNDFEDAIHYQAAKASGCEAIITRNAKDFKEADLAVLSPQEFVDQLKSSQEE